MTHDPFDLLIRAGRLFCAASALDGPGVVAVRDGRIAAAGADVSGPARQTLDFPSAVLLPGLVDLHAHPAKSHSDAQPDSPSVFGVDPDEFMLRHGTTTVASQGDAGADNWPAYLAGTIERSQARVLLAMNLSRVGESTEAGCFERLDDADVDACVKAVECARPHVWAIAVNVSHHACGRTDPRQVLERGLSAGEATGLPLLYGMRRPQDWPLAEQLQRLRPGDVVTYCYRREPHCIVSGGRVLPEVREARRRGVLFDVGHGTASFDFDVAAAAIADGFPPDTISTDLQRRHAGLTPRHDLPRTMSKLRAAGMPTAAVFAAVTRSSAMALRRDDLGTLAPGAEADLTLLEWNNEGCGAAGGQWQAALTIRAGCVVADRSTMKACDVRQAR